MARATDRAICCGCGMIHYAIWCPNCKSTVMIKTMKDDQRANEYKADKKGMDSDQNESILESYRIPEC